MLLPKGPEFTVYVQYSECDCANAERHFKTREEVFVAVHTIPLYLHAGTSIMFQRSFQKNSRPCQAHAIILREWLAQPSISEKSQHKLTYSRKYSSPFPNARSSTIRTGTAYFSHLTSINAVSKNIRFIEEKNTIQNSNIKPLSTCYIIIIQIKSNRIESNQIKSCIERFVLPQHKRPGLLVRADECWHRHRRCRHLGPLREAPFPLPIPPHTRRPKHDCLYSSKRTRAHWPYNNSNMLASHCNSRENKYRLSFGRLPFQWSGLDSWTISS